MKFNYYKHYIKCYNNADLHNQYFVKVTGHNSYGRIFVVILNIIYKCDRMHVIKMHILDYQDMSKGVLIKSTESHM